MAGAGIDSGVFPGSAGKIIGPGRGYERPGLALAGSERGTNSKTMINQAEAKEIGLIGKQKRLLLLCLLIPLLSCGKPEPGDFGWAALNKEGMGEIEEMLLQPRDYRIRRDRLFFSESQTIYWIYRIESGSFDTEKFLAALYTTGESPEPVEIDLRRLELESGAGGYVFRQYYEPLDPGSYILKIAYESIPFDQVEFQVIPEPDPWQYADNVTDEEEGFDPLLHYSTGDSAYENRERNPIENEEGGDTDQWIYDPADKAASEGL